MGTMLGAHMSTVTFEEADTLYSDPFQPNAASRLAAQSLVRSGSPAAVTITLQGGWTDSDKDTDDDWADLDFTSDSVALDSRASLSGTTDETTIYAEWPVYRYKVEADEECVVEIRTTELG